MTKPLSAAALAAGLVLALPLSSQQVLRVDETGAGGAFLDLQAAVDAAVDGSLILVEDGQYAGMLIVDKTLRIAADAGAAPVLTDRIMIQSLAPTRSVELHGLTQRLGSAGVMVTIDQCAGSVLIQDCDLAQAPLAVPIAAGVSIVSSSAVTLVRTTVDLRPAPQILLFPFAVEARDSGLFVHGCDLYGGKGVPADPFTATDGGIGTPALQVAGGHALVSGSRLFGGPGGDGTFDPLFLLCADGGQGGPALRLVPDRSSAPEVVLSGVTLLPGPAGAGNGCSPGIPGVEPLDLQAGQVIEAAVLPREFASEVVVREGEVKTNQFSGQPFDFLWQMFSVNPGTIVYSPLITGVIYPGNPFFLRFRGVLDAAGEKTLSTTIADTGLAFVPLYEQALFYNTTEGFTVSNPQLVLLLDGATP
jgi:hypothetical protein